MSRQELGECGHMGTADSPCRCRVGRRSNVSANLPGTLTQREWEDVLDNRARQVRQTADNPCRCDRDDNGTMGTCTCPRPAPVAWMDERSHTDNRTPHESEWIAAMRKRFSDGGGSGTGEYCMWLEERLYALEARRDIP